MTPDKKTRRGNDRDRRAQKTRPPRELEGKSSKEEAVEEVFEGPVSETEKTGDSAKKKHECGKDLEDMMRSQHFTQRCVLKTMS